MGGSMIGPVGSARMSDAFKEAITVYIGLGRGERYSIASISSICISRKKIKNGVRPTIGNKPPFGRGGKL
jgi:hypothetical protein